jgi:hypothetical protein
MSVAEAIQTVGLRGFLGSAQSPWSAVSTIHTLWQAEALVERLEQAFQFEVQTQDQILDFVE